MYKIFYILHNNKEMNQQIIFLIIGFAFVWFLMNRRQFFEGNPMRDQQYGSVEQVDERQVDSKEQTPLDPKRVLLTNDTLSQLNTVSIPTMIEPIEKEVMTKDILNNQ